MALTLTELFERRSDPNIRNPVQAACWKHAKTLIAKASPTIEELRQASKLLSGVSIETYIIAVCVIIDDGTADDAAIEAAVVTIANKLLALES